MASNAWAGLRIEANEGTIGRAQGEEATGHRRVLVKGTSRTSDTDQSIAAKKIYGRVYSLPA